MKTKLLFYAVQKFKNGIKLSGIFTFLIIFFMTISSFSQSNGISFNCNGNIVSFGAPETSEINGYPYWINGTDNISTSTDEYLLFVQVYLGVARWEVHKAIPGVNFPIDFNFGELYFLSEEFNEISPTCGTSWQSSGNLIAFCPSATSDCTGGPIEEVCEDQDNDGFTTCDGDCNDNDSTVSSEQEYFVDSDEDGFGSTVTAMVCASTPPPGYSDNDEDCDDTNENINPDASEIPDDGIDQDCDGVDDVTPTIDFVIVAEEEVHLHGNNVVTGNVGATDYDGKIKLHEYSSVSGSIEASEVEINNGSSVGSTILTPYVVDLPPFVFNLVSDDSDFDITVEQGQTITLNDQIYGKIEVKEGGTLIFNNSNVFIEELKAYNNTTIAFTGCTNLFINKRVKFEDNTVFNSNGDSVAMYVDDDVIVEEGSNVIAYIYANKYIEAKSKDENPVSMTGFFSGKKVKGEKAVSWQGQSGYIPCEIIEPEITEEDLCDCKDGMVSLTIAYNGTGILTTNSGVIDDNQDGTYTISNYGDKIDKDLEISDGDGELSSFATIHTSCSQEILNVTYDEAFTVISYTDNIGNTCEVNFSSKVAFEDVPQDEPVLEFKVSVWPNPTNDFFNVKMTSPNTIDKVSLNAFDINGRLIHSTIINGNEDYEFGDRLQSGMYFVKITQANSTEVIKVIKR